ncbi:Uncharacterised protein [Afipia felis]|uniref:Uncharacterized protein n=2 Tax=Afipia felis TaxID=1035 RepID=A0A380WCY4_AFIFE|nr:hypothetical protein HMPREF9697_02275 [Afipia felis ATCC 53690]SUU78454.1 Uncharacterised protein [Afipia felis]SUU86519.1 Uncharacterised protein [Afipia felis]
MMYGWSMCWRFGSWHWPIGQTKKIASKQGSLCDCQIRTRLWRYRQDLALAGRSDAARTIFDRVANAGCPSRTTWYPDGASYLARYFDFGLSRVPFRVASGASGRARYFAIGMAAQSFRAYPLVALCTRSRNDAERMAFCFSTWMGSITILRHSIADANITKFDTHSQDRRTASDHGMGAVHRDYCSCGRGTHAPASLQGSHSAKNVARQIFIASRLCPR